MGEKSSFAERSPDESRRECRVEAPLLVFVHLRKTAGTTISYVMRRQFRPHEVIEINSPTVEGPLFVEI